MPKIERTRIDYMPGNAGLDALALAAEMFPNLRQQALIDRLVIVAVSALKHEHWRPPIVGGLNRDAWTLPHGLKRKPD